MFAVRIPGYNCFMKPYKLKREMQALRLESALKEAVGTLFEPGYRGHERRLELARTWDEEELRTGVALSEHVLGKIGESATLTLAHSRDENDLRNGLEAILVLQRWLGKRNPITGLPEYPEES